MKDAKLIMFMVLKDNLRSHNGVLYKYEQGSWHPAECLQYQNHDEIIAVEGIFIRLSEIADLQWDWNEVMGHVKDLVDEKDD